MKKQKIDAITADPIVIDSTIYFSGTQELLNDYYRLLFTRDLNSATPVIKTVILSCSKEADWEHSSITFGLITAIKNNKNPVEIIISAALPEEIRDNFETLLSFYKKIEEVDNVDIRIDIPPNTINSGSHKQYLPSIFNIIPSFNEEVQESLTENYRLHFSNLLTISTKKIILACNTPSELEQTSLIWGLLKAIQQKAASMEIVISPELPVEIQAQFESIIESYLGNFPEIHIQITPSQPPTLEEPATLKEMCNKVIRQCYTHHSIFKSNSLEILLRDGVANPESLNILPTELQEKIVDEWPLELYEETLKNFKILPLQFQADILKYVEKLPQESKEKIFQELDSYPPTFQAVLRKSFNPLSSPMTKSKEEISFSSFQK